jgi:hypothetical protein
MFIKLKKIENIRSYKVKDDSLFYKDSNKNIFRNNIKISENGYDDMHITNNSMFFNNRNGDMKADAVLVKYDEFGDIDDIIIIENKLSQATAFTTRQKEGFRTIKNSTTEIVEIHLQYSRQGLDITENPIIRVNKSKVLKINDAGTDNINSIGINDIHLITDLNF